MFWKPKKAPPPADARQRATSSAASSTAPAGPPREVFAAGFRAHQAGRLDEAARAYRDVLRVLPDDFDARHLLGVIALQQDRLDEARDEITRALRANPRDAAAHGNLGTVHLRAGRLADARANFQEALRIQPRNVNALANLATALRGLGEPRAAVKPLRDALAAGGPPSLRNDVGAALLEAGDAQAAIREFRAALQAQPSNADAHGNLALALERSGETASALKEYERALALAPGHAKAANNRAVLLAKLGRTDEARRAFEQLVQSNTQSADAWANLGAFLRESGEWAAARSALEKALAIEPKLAEARFNLVQAALDTGDTATADKMLDALAADQPRSAEVLMLRGQSAIAQARWDDARAALERAVELDPKLANAHHLLGLAHMARADDALARASHQEAARLDPAHAQARWAAVMARLPALVDDEAQARQSREAFAQGVHELDAWFQGARVGTGRTAVGSTQPFYLAYQRGNHRDLLTPYGKLCSRLAGGGVVAAPAVRASGRLRVGIVSAHVRDHSVWTAIVRGWVANLDRSKFDIAIFHVGAMKDAQTEAARRLVTQFEDGPASDGEWLRRIAAFGPDALIYPEVGMDSTTTRLASQRLAPLQMASWGHPLTTGLPTIDVFVSARSLEPADAPSHYTEELLALPGLGVCYEPLDVREERFDRGASGLPAKAPLLLCPGLPQKYAPQDDALWADIAHRIPEARLVFFRTGAPTLHERLAQRMRRAFEAKGLRYEDHVATCPPLSRPQFFALMREAALFLDSVGFSGFNTAMQAIQCALPIVTMEGDSLRGRFGSGLLREAVLDECVAVDASAYVDIAAALARDSAHRLAIAAHLRKHGPRLFGTREPVAALAAFIESRLKRA